MTRIHSPGWSGALGLAMSLMLVLLAVAPGAAQEGGATLTGQVTEESSQRPLAGVQVFLREASMGQLTNSQGRFLLRDVPPGQYTVGVQLLGYTEVAEQVTLAAGQSLTLDVTLRQEALALDGIVVTGQAGQARRREVGNTISQINLTQIDEPVQSVDQLLQGRTTSMTVNAGSAAFGSGAMIRLRGNSSMSQSNQPIVYIDGVRQSSDSYPLNRSDNGSFALSPQATGSPLNDINPNDIERIEVVKGAAATTLYGSEAAGGVIQIFTKRGSQGQPSWTFQTDHTLDWVQEYGSDQRPYIGMDPFLKTAYGTTNALSVAGGAGGVQYFVSGNVAAGEGVHPNDEQMRYGFRGNMGFNVHPDVNIQWNTSYMNDDLDLTHIGNNSMGLQFNAYRAPNNSVGSADPAVIAELLDAEMYQTNTRFTSGLTANWDAGERLSNRFVIGLDRMSTDMGQFNPWGHILDPVGSVASVNWTSQTSTVDYTGSFRFRFTDTLGSAFSWGAQQVITDETRLDGYGQGFPGPGRHTLNATAIKTVSENSFRTINAGFFLQNMFDVADRFFLTVGTRVDGNSAFGENLGLQVYPKVSASYVVSDEAFWPETWGEVKLRGAYGHAGRAPGAFDAVRTWNPNSFGGQSAFIPSNVGNPDLGPERTQELEVGFDASLLEGRLTADLSYYRQATTDALFNVAQTPSNGFLGSQLENVGELRNSGLELAVNGTVIQQPNFGWDLGGSISTNHSEIIDVGTATSASIVVGQPAPVVVGTRIVNADAFEDPEIELNHYFGPNLPTLTLGVNTSLDLPAGFRLSARGEYQGGHFLSDAASSAMVNRGAGAAQCDAAYEHVPFNAYGSASPEALSNVRAKDRARCYAANLQGNMWIHPADFFKLRDVTLQAPLSSLIPGVRSAILTFSLRNAFRWTNSEFTAFDPEMNASRDGVRALTSGITETTPPPARFTTSVRIAF